MNNIIKQMATICGLLTILSIKLGLLVVEFVLESILLVIDVIVGFNVSTAFPAENLIDNVLQ